MDFVSSFPHTSHGSDDIWVIVDKLTMLTHFIPIQMSCSAERFTHIYIRAIVRSHGVPISINSYRVLCLLLAFGQLFMRC